MKSMREWASIIIAALSLLGYAWIEISHNDVQNASRISKLEAHREDAVKQSDRIEEDLRSLNNKVDRLVEWAMGGKK